MKIWILSEYENKDSSEPMPYDIERFLEEGLKKGLQIELRNPSDFELFVDGASNKTILYNGAPVSVPDFAIPRMLIKDRGGYFPLAVIRHLERMGTQVLNSAYSIERVIDKLHTHQILVEHGISTPATLLGRFPLDLDMVESRIGFPVVVKTLQGTCGTGVFMAKDRQSFKDVMDLIAETSSGVQIIFQKFIEASHGRDLRLLVCGGKVIATMERRAADGGFKANFSTGGSVQSFVPDRVAVDMALRTSRALGLDFAGVDLLFDEGGGYTVCEANAMPGFKGLESCCNVNVPDAVFNMLLAGMGFRKRIFPMLGIQRFNPFRSKMAA